MEDEDPKDKLALARLMKSVAGRPMNSSQKDSLWNRIAARTLDNQRFLGRRFMWLAASVAILLSAGLGIYLFTRQPFDQILQASASQFPIDSLRPILYLGDNTRIKIPVSDFRVLVASDGAKLSILTSGGKTLKSINIIDKEAVNALTIPYGSHARMRLSDGSEIWLNSGSKLLFSGVFPKKNRQIYLEGEGYFAISHLNGSSFTANLNNSAIKVLGTEFLICAYPDDSTSTAVLAKGSIELIPGQQAGAEPKKLMPGMRAVVSKDGELLGTDRVSPVEYVSWKDGYLLLKNTPLSEILRKLSRRYNTKILLESDSLGKTTFSGHLSLDPKIDNALHVISLSTSLIYTKSNNQIIMRKR